MSSSLPLIADSFDSRPPLDILFIGNSRTYYNDMPQMLRKIADSARSSQKYRITMQAPAGIRLQDHWYDIKVQSLLRQKWNYVVLQGRSNEQLDDEVNTSFQTYGKALANLAKANGATPVLFVPWRYADGDETYKRLWCITEADRSATTLLLPQEY